MPDGSRDEGTDSPLIPQQYAVLRSFSRFTCQWGHLVVKFQERGAPQRFSRAKLETPVQNKWPYYALYMPAGYP
eukprot:1138891-Pelagomonas_calceolata.AAC.3